MEPGSRDCCAPSRRALASRPLSRDCKKLEKEPSSPSPATPRASEMLCSLPSSRVAAVAAAATDSRRESNAVLSSGGS